MSSLPLVRRLKHYDTNEWERKGERGGEVVIHPLSTPFKWHLKAENILK
jgi:hypothetical protein